MPKEQWVADLKQGVIANTQLMIKRMEKKPFKNKEGHFLHMSLGDKTGDITAICWDPGLIKDDLSSGDVVSIAAPVNRHQEFGMQMVIRPESIKKETSFVLADYLKASDKDIEVLFSYLIEKISLIKDVNLKKLLEHFFHDESFAKEFKNAPAAKLIHHNFVGGLLEHTYNVLKICESLIETHSEIDNDLLVVGAILHDVGKIKEYQQNNTIDVTEEGGLIGHPVLGREMVNEAIITIEDFPDVLRMKLGHMILSHHAKLEYGSPKRPKFLEANALAYADLLDARVQSFKQEMKEKSDNKAEGDIWVKSNMIGHYVYLK